MSNVQLSSSSDNFVLLYLQCHYQQAPVA